MNTPEKKPPVEKMPYRAPVLEIYGNIREITRAITPTGTKNDMAGGPQKTG